MAMPFSSRRSTIYMLTAILLSSFMTALLSLALAAHFYKVSERKWCDVIVTIDDANHETPPATTSGRNFAAKISTLRSRLDCEESS